MLAIRLKRTGRSGHAQFRVIVQDSRFSPSGGRIVAYLGSYDPHTKATTIDSQTAAKYLENGAQPSDRVARLLQNEGVKLPAWVKLSDPKERGIRNPDKRRSTRPAEPEAPASATEPETEAPAAEQAAPEPKSETPTTESAAAPEETQAPAEIPADEPKAETPAEPPAKSEPAADDDAPAQTPPAE